MNDGDKCGGMRRTARLPPFRGVVVLAPAFGVRRIPPLLFEIAARSRDASAQGRRAHPSGTQEFTDAIFSQ